MGERSSSTSRCHCPSWPVLMVVVTILLVTFIEGITAFTVTASVKKISGDGDSSILKPEDTINISCEFDLSLDKLQFLVFLDQAGKNVYIYQQPEGGTKNARYKDRILGSNPVPIDLGNGKMVLVLQMKVSACFPVSFKCSVWNKDAVERSDLAPITVKQLNDPVMQEDGTTVTDIVKVQRNRTSIFTCGVKNVTENATIAFIVSVNGKETRYIGEASEYTNETCLYHGSVNSNATSLTVGDQVKLECQANYSSESKSVISDPVKPGTVRGLPVTTTVAIAVVVSVACIIIIVVFVVIIIKKKKVRISTSDSSNHQGKNPTGKP